MKKKLKRTTKAKLLARALKPVTKVSNPMFEKWDGVNFLSQAKTVVRASFKYGYMCYIVKNKSKKMYFPKYYIYRTKKPVH